MTAFGEGTVGSPEQWKEDFVAAGTTPDGLTAHDLDAATATLDDIPPLHVDNLTLTKVDAPAVERGSKDASATAPTRSDTTGTNLVAMLRDVNRGSGDSFFNLENQWRTLLRDNPGTRLETTIRPFYMPGASAPHKIEVDFRINGGRPERRVVNNG